MSLERLFVLLPGELKRAARIKAATEAVTLSDVVRAFVAQWVAGELPTPCTVRQ